MRAHSTPVRGLFSRATDVSSARFGRMFDLPPATFGASDEESFANLTTLAQAMEANDLPKDGKDDEESAIPALYTYLGQFIDHDLTFDPASSLQKQNDPNALVDFRTPAFDLDCLYGRGPDDQPYMYDDDKAFVLGESFTNGAKDLPRAAGSGGRAIIGDPRNDENRIVSQLQGLFLQFHNRMLGETGLPFPEVQKAVRYHYQYMVLNDFLRRIVHSSVLEELKTDGKFDAAKLAFFKPAKQPFMPVEFSGAAYRFGHSMIRPGYRMNDRNLLAIFPALAGFRPANLELGIDWGRFIDIELRASDENDPSTADAVKRNRLQFAYKIDTSLVEPLKNLGRVVNDAPPSLATRNLLRGFRLGLPSGQAVAKYIGAPVLEDTEIKIGSAAADPSTLPDITELGTTAFNRNCPLWVYILAEAMHHQEEDLDPLPVLEGGKTKAPRLGPVGGRIVAEVFLGLMFSDPNSVLYAKADFKPMVPADFRLKDFVKYALGL
jgi:hypothetical protein